MADYVPITHKEFFAGYSAALEHVWKEGFIDSNSGKNKAVRERGEELMAICKTYAAVNTQRFKDFSEGKEMLAPAHGFFAQPGEYV